MSHDEEIKEYLEIEKSLQSQPKNYRFIDIFSFFLSFQFLFIQRGEFIEEQAGGVKIDLLSDK